MTTYDMLRQLADSWGLIYMLIIFLAVIIYTFRPGSKQTADEIAQIPLREED